METIVTDSPLGWQNGSSHRAGDQTCLALTFKRQLARRAMSEDAKS
jgi:hypothetical protein